MNKERRPQLIVTMTEFEPAGSCAFLHYAPNLTVEDAKSAARDLILYGTGVVHIGGDGSARYVPYHEYMEAKK